MFLWSNIAYHCSSKTSDYGCADSRCDVVVCRGNVCGQWAERVERSFVASLLFTFHIGRDFVHRHVSGPFYQHLHVVFPCFLGEFSEHVEFQELGAVVGIMD